MWAVLPALASARPSEQEPSEEQLVVLLLASELQADLVLHGLVSPFVPEPPFERVSLLELILVTEFEMNFRLAAPRLAFEQQVSLPLVLAFQLKQLAFVQVPSPILSFEPHVLMSVSLDFPLADRLWLAFALVAELSFALRLVFEQPVLSVLVSKLIVLLLLGLELAFGAAASLLQFAGLSFVTYLVVLFHFLALALDSLSVHFV